MTIAPGRHGFANAEPLVAKADIKFTSDSTAGFFKPVIFLDDQDAGMASTMASNEFRRRMHQLIGE